MTTDYAETIKSLIDIRSVIEYYGINLDRRDKALCPFHSEKTASFTIFPDTNTFKCFGCGAGGDVISFVIKLFGLTFYEAMKKLNLDFVLNLPLGQQISMRQLQKVQERTRELEKQHAVAELKRLEAERDYWKLWDEMIRLDNNKRQYKPESMDEPLNPLFVEALQNYEYQKYLINSLL